MRVHIAQWVDTSVALEHFEFWHELCDHFHRDAHRFCIFGSNLCDCPVALLVVSAAGFWCVGAEGGFFSLALFACFLWGRLKRACELDGARMRRQQHVRLGLIWKPTGPGCNELQFFFSFSRANKRPTRVSRGKQIETNSMEEVVVEDVPIAQAAGGCAAPAAGKVSLCWV